MGRTGDDRPAEGTALRAAGGLPRDPSRIRALKLFRPPAHLLLVLPATALVFVAFVYPVGVVLARSFTEPPGGLSHYQEFLHSSYLVTIFNRSFLIASLVTGISLLVSYPYAYVAATSRRSLRTVLLGVVVSSLMVSVIVRSYAWLAILDRNGALNVILSGIGLERFRVTLVHNKAGVLIGLVQYAIPLMVLPLYDIMARLNPRVLHAAASLGARPSTVFARVYFPLTFPGVAAGVALVFITTLGYFIIPAILGGPQGVMIGNVIGAEFSTFLQWGLGAALSGVLLIVAIVSFIIFYGATRRYQERRRYA